LDIDTTIQQDELATFVGTVELAFRDRDFPKIHDLILSQTPAVWFGLKSERFFEIIETLVTEYPETNILIRTCHEMVAAPGPGSFDLPEIIAAMDIADPQQMFFLTLFRMFEGRLHGYPVDSLEQSEQLEKHLGKMRPFAYGQAGWGLHVPIQIGVSAMLAGDFTRALAAFTQAQLHPTMPKFSFLMRDALVKSGLIHAAFGEIGTAQSLLERSEQIPRTSSWVEAQIDVHRDFAKLLATDQPSDQALETLQSFDLHDIGEMWPFYILATHRLFDAGGLHAELEHQLSMFDSMPFPKQDGIGFTGSIIPLKRALVAMRGGRVSEAQEFMDRADPRLAYTQLIQAALHLLAGRPNQAKHEALRLHDETRGYRLLEVRRLAILAASHLQSGDMVSSINTLEQAAALPHGLRQGEVLLFSPETRELARNRVSKWPAESPSASLFLTGLPKPGLALTEREIEIIGQLAAGHTRAQISENLFISLNTVKTQLQSIYRKLAVSSRDEAVQGAQRRGLI